MATAIGNTTTTVTTTTQDSIESMSFLILYNGHNGEMIKIPKPIRYHTINDFKRFILESFTNYLIDSIENIFLLTSFGIKLNFNIVNEINEVYIFDKRLFNQNEFLIKEYYNLNLGNYNNLMIEYKHLSQESSILRLSGKNLPHVNIRDFTSNLKQFKLWSHNLFNNAVKVNELITEQYLKQINNIFKSVKTIFEFINNFINEIEKTFNHHYNFIKLLNYKSLVSTWKDHYNSLKYFPPVKIDNHHQSHKISLVSWLNYNELANKAKYVETHLPLILSKFNEMINDINHINDEKVHIDQMIEVKRTESMSNFKTNLNSHLLGEFTSYMTEIDHTLNQLSSNELDFTPSTINEIYHKSKTINKSLLSISDQVIQNLSKTLKFKMSLLTTNYEIFNKISSLQMKIVEIKNDLKRLSSPQTSPSSSINVNSNSINTSVSFETVNNIKQAEDYLSLTIDLPLLFGFMLIEKRRQFEWFDFYSKGIINNVTEQLITIIDHEKLFQKLWLKKFGNFTKILLSSATGTTENDLGLKPVLPNLDITLINNNDHQLIFKLLGDLQIERDDVMNYIKSIEDYETKFNLNNKFSNLLNKNFKDLLKSTNNMKSVTKLITSISNYTSPTEDLSNSKVRKIIETDNDEFNENLIKGLKSRIKKLEDLLHQQQFKNLSNWPVTRGYTPPPVSHTQLKVSSTSPNRTNSPSQASPSPTNPTQLLRKSSGANTLDASITIDKHLDNLRLKKENKELVDENARLRQENLNSNRKVEELLAQVEQLKHHEQETYQEQFKMKEHEVTELQSQLDKRNSTIHEYQVMNESKDQKIIGYEEKLYQYEQEIKDLKGLKEDLMSNMTSKELEHIKNHNNLEQEIKDLSSRLEEITESYEDLMELTNNRQDLIHELNLVIINLLHHIKSAVSVHYDFFMEFVLVLESIGLLLVKEINEETKQVEYKITRVKGLRSKKSTDDTNGDVSLVSIENNHKPNTKVIEDINEVMKWINQIDLSHIVNDEVKSISTNINDDVGEVEETDEAQELIKLFNNHFQDGDSDFTKFLKTISFKDEDHDDFFLSAISKRFRDVEGFAKKLTKENKLKVQEISRLNKSLHGKISINNFNSGDLVLFLPTRIDNMNEVKLNHQPWAAFNVGAPHFFLNTANSSDSSDGHLNLSNKEWLVAKIVSINQYVVTESNVDNKDENPFQLSLGITWYLISAKEETLN